jgi:hypothetical protein
MQMLSPDTAPLPLSFCWTRFGPEAGESFSQILERKERERRANRGFFYWGIGNPLRPGIAELVKTSDGPEVLFSAIRSRPRPKDVSPAVTVRWTVAEDMDGTRFDIPSAVVVHSARDDIDSTRPHYALVCHSAEPLDLRELGRIWFGALRNLRTGSPVGASQVTAVVRRLESELGAPYSVVFRARLVAPYFVRLHAPVPVVTTNTPRI